MTPGPDPRPETRPAVTKRQPAKTLGSAPPGGEETFPAAHCEKSYQPTVFTGMSIIIYTTLRVNARF